MIAALARAVNAFKNKMEQKKNFNFSRNTDKLLRGVLAVGARLV